MHVESEKSKDAASAQKAKDSKAGATAVRTEKRWLVLLSTLVYKNKKKKRKNFLITLLIKTLSKRKRANKKKKQKRRKYSYKCEF